MNRLAPLFALALMAQSPAPTDPDDIVVIARKLGRWSGSWEPNNGNPTCQTNVSTGDAAIDKIGCDAMLFCVPRFQLRMDAAVENARVQGKLKTRRDAVRMSRLPVYREFSACVAEQRKAGIRELAQRRRAER